MIESSVIKLILIVALNMFFVLVWVKKESLRSFMPFEFISKLSEKNFLKNCKKIKIVISFIGNINMFWILNISYFLLIKFFEKELNLILGFSEGTTKDLMIESNILKSSYIYANSLGGVTKILFDSGNFIGLFIGVTALMIPIYLYIIGFKSKSKRQLLLMLTKKGDMFYLSFFIYIMMFFRVEKLFLVGAIGYLIFLLMEAVKWIMKIENSLYSFEGLDKILKLQEEEEIVELYNTTLNELYQGVKDSNASTTDENNKLLLLLLRNNIIKIEKTKNQENTKDLIGSLYDIYDVVIRNQDDDIYRAISYLHIDIAQYYFKNNDKENFYSALCEVKKVYNYYYKDGTDKFDFKVLSGFDFDSFGLYEQYRDNFEEGKLWYAKKFRAIMEGIKKSEKNDDLYFFKQFIYLIEQEFEYKEKIKRDYKLLEDSVYFGILLYLKEEKIKKINNRIEYKKIDKFIKFIEKKILNNTNLINLIELYEFISQEMIGYRRMLNWENYFEPKMELVKITTYIGRLNEEKNELFLELLGKTKYSKYDEDTLYNEEQFKDSLEIANSNYMEIDIDFEKSFKRIQKFKIDARSLLNDLENSKDKIKITEESYQRIKKILEDLDSENKQKENEKLRESKISKIKINKMIKVLEKELKESKIIELFKIINKYKLSKEGSEAKCIGINKYYGKNTFTELDNSNLIENLSRNFGKAQNNGINNIIVRALDKNSEVKESLEKALEEINGNPFIILNGVGIFRVFKNKANIIHKPSLDKSYFEKYSDLLGGLYLHGEKKIPIYILKGDEKGIYILDSDDIEAFTHYNANLEIKDSKGVEKEFEDLIGYASLKITDTKKILEKRKEEVLKYEWLQEYDSNEEKIKHFKELVLVEFNQKGELKLKEDAKVYKVEFKG